MESRMFLKIARPKISVISPKNRYIQEVKEKSGESGELHELSEADISLLALALQFVREERGKTVVVTEDYSIQNYCSLYNIPFISLGKKQITEKRIILKRCEACGKEYPVKLSECPSCGSEQFSTVHKFQEE